VGVDNKDVAMGELLNINLGIFKGDNRKTQSDWGRAGDWSLFPYPAVDVNLTLANLTLAN
jgi:hypothetical protein